jgi:hypothetical protein
MQTNLCESSAIPLGRRYEQVSPKDQIVCPSQMQIGAMGQHDGLDFGRRQAVDGLDDRR